MNGNKLIEIFIILQLFLCTLKSLSLAAMDIYSHAVSCIQR